MPSPSVDRPDLAQADQRRLVEIARESIRHSLDGRGAWHHAPEHLPAALLEQAASFVTLRRATDLLGCIGTIEPRQPLAHDVAANAAGAAFADPRLPAVTRDDFAEMSVKVSVLGPLERLAVGSIDELRSVLHVGTDGLLIIDGRRRATFLPSVWDQAPTVDNFLALLWDKAGLRRAQWPRRLDLYRYETQEFGD